MREADSTLIPNFAAVHGWCGVAVLSDVCFDLRRKYAVHISGGSADCAVNALSKQAALLLLLLLLCMALLL
jgi:hypothetical protein